jgi:hypothetical protein
MSARGAIATDFVSTLLSSTGSWVALPAVVVTAIVPDAAAMNVLVQVMTEVGVNGLAAAVQICVAPAGKPVSAQVGAAALLGPRLLHTPLTVTDCPAMTVAGNVVTAFMSAKGTTMSESVSVLLAMFGSNVALVVVPVTLIVPVVGAVKLTLHEILSPTARAATGDDGKQVTIAPAGSPETTQVTVVAVLGPPLVQVTLPVTVEPASGLVGKPVTATAISATAVTPSGLVSTLFAVMSSCVRLRAVVLILSAPLTGATKVLVQVIVAFTASVVGSGSGVQLCCAPGGRPLKTQLGVSAMLGPKLVQTPLTVTTSPTLGASAGTVVTAAISAFGTVPMED